MMHCLRCLLCFACLADLAFATWPAGCDAALRPEVVAPQGRQVFGPRGGGGPPSGGTPEPASILLLVGGALGYGAYRLKRAKERPPQDR